MNRISFQLIAFLVSLVFCAAAHASPEDTFFNSNTPGSAGSGWHLDYGEDEDLEEADAEVKPDKKEQRSKSAQSKPKKKKE